MTYCLSGALAWLALGKRAGSDMSVSLAVLILAAQDVEFDADDGEDDDQHHRQHRRRSAQVAVEKAAAIGLIHDQIGRQ